MELAEGKKKVRAAAASAVLKLSETSRTISKTKTTKTALKTTQIKNVSSTVAKALFDATALRSYVECPICLDVPRHGIMLQCIKGHNVCKGCKDEMGKDAKCPQCRCGFHNPPAKNFTVANLIESFPFEWPCKYNNLTEAGCRFEGSVPALSGHEVNCGHQMIQCPQHACSEKVPLHAVAEHCRSAHKITARVLGSNEGTRGIMWKDSHFDSEALNWFEASYGLDCCEWTLLCSRYEKGHLFIWMWSLLGEDEAERLECTFTIGNGNNSNNNSNNSNNGNSMVVTAPVFPLTWDRQKVLQDKRCVRLGTWIITQMLTKEGIKEKHREKGYSSRLSVSFRVSRKAD